MKGIGKLYEKMKVKLQIKQSEALIKSYENDIKELIYKSEYEYADFLEGDKDYCNHALKLYELLIDKEERRINELKGRSDKNYFKVRYDITKGHRTYTRDLFVAKDILDGYNYIQAKRKILDIIKSSLDGTYDIIELELYKNKYIQLVYIIPDELLDGEISKVGRVIYETTIRRRLK